MPDDITTIKDKYKVPTEGAIVILNTAIATGKPIHIIASYYNLLSNHGERSVNQAQMLNQLHAREIGGLRAKQRVSTKDDLSTLKIKTGFTGGIKEKDQAPRFISTRRMVGEGEIRTETRRSVPPKYYYYNLDLTFDVTGKDRPPSYDTQFRGFHEGVPYARVTTDKVVSPSKYPIEYIDDSGNIVKKKLEGYKLLTIDLFNLAGHAGSQKVKLPYEGIAEFEIAQGRKLVNIIRQMLSEEMTDQITSFYNDIKSNKTTADIMRKLDVDESKKLASKKMFREYYGEDFTLERKRKLKKTSPKRKTAKKVVKKKCSCMNTRKRKIASIKKKLLPRRSK